jgi:hypothetical protein
VGGWGREREREVRKREGQDNSREEKQSRGWVGRKGREKSENIKRCI